MRCLSLQTAECRIVGQGAVGVSVEMPGAMMRLVPDTHRIVAQDDTSPPFHGIRIRYFHLIDILDPLESVRHRFCGFVMIAANQPDSSIQLAANRLCRRQGHQKDVSEMVDDVVSSHDCVPVGDKAFVHLFDICKRAFRVTNNKIGRAHV